MRTGLITQKLGMTRVFAEDGEHIPVTVLKVDGADAGQRRNQCQNAIAWHFGGGSQPVDRIDAFREP